MRSLILVLLIGFLLMPLLISSQTKDCRTDADCPQNQFCDQTSFQCELKPTSTTGVGVIVTPSETPETTATQSPIIPSEQDCQDSDGEDIFTRGVTIAITDYIHDLHDECVDNKIVNEVVCKGFSAEYKKISCPEKHKCEDGRCVEVKGTVNFQVDEQIFGPRTAENPYGRGLDRELNKESYFVDRTVTDYDSLVCKFETSKKVDSTAIIFKIYDSLGKVIAISPKDAEVFGQSASCGETSCEAKIGRFNFKRGIELSGSDKSTVNEVRCEVAYNGEVTTSEPLSIANHLYIFVHLAPPYVENYKEQYEYFLARTQLDRKSAKPVYRSQGNNCEPAIKYRFEKAVRKGRLSENESKILDKLDFIDVLSVVELCSMFVGEFYNDKYDVIIGLTNSRDILGNSEGYTGGRLGGNNAIVVGGDITDVTAHEIGHLYELCDEYKHSDYNNPTPYSICKNQYPPCCFDSSGDQSETGNNCYWPNMEPNFNCAGMPIDGNGIPQITNGIADITTPYRSIMGAPLLPSGSGYPYFENSYPLKPGIPIAS